MDLVTVLQNAQNPDQAIRTQAEHYLNQAIEAQYGPFLLALTVELATEGKPDNSRQLAGLYIKNLITAKDANILNMKTQKWLECDPTLKDQIRMGFLQALLSPVKQVSHTTAQILGAYGAVDLPRKEWPLLLSALLNNVTNPEVPVMPKISSLEALGYMCETMDPDSVEGSVVAQILSAVIDGMRSDRPNEVRLAGIVALINSLDFAGDNFKNDTERDVIVRTICEATQCTDVKVRGRAYECFGRIAELYYEKLTAYVETFFQLTTGAIKSDDPSVGIMAIEFWSTVCDREIEALNDINDEIQDAVYLQLTEQAAPQLVPILLEALTKQVEDTAGDDDSWSIATAAAACLDAIARTVDDNIIPLVVPFVQENITNANWRLKEAAVMAFASILDGPKSEKIVPMVVQAMSVLIGCLGDAHSMVRESTAWTIGRICELHKEALGAEIFPSLIQGLSNALSDASAKVVSQACFAAHNLAEACTENREDDSNVLSHFMPHMLEKLLTVTNRDDCEVDNLRVSAYEAVNMMVANSAKDMKPIVIQLLAEALNRLENTFGGQVDAHERMNLQSSLCSLTGACVQKLDATEVTPSSDRIMQLLLQVFAHKGAIAHEDAFMAIGFVADKLASNFSKYMPYLSPIIIMGLRNIEEYQVCTACVGVVGDVCRALTKGVVPFCDDIMRCLLELLQSTTVNRSVKPHVISVFSDIAMAIEGDFDRYTSIVLGILKQAGEIASEQDDEDLIDYINTLRSSILEAYTGILQGLKDAGKQDSVLPAVEAILGLLQRCAEDDNKSSEVLKAAVGLVGDIAQIFGSRISKPLQQSFIQSLLAEGVEEGEDVGFTAAWAKTTVAAAVSAKGGR